MNKLARTFSACVAAAAALLIAACGESPAEREVKRVLGPLPSALLSVSGANGTLWVVGAADEAGALLASRSKGGDRFERVDLRPVDPTAGDLWWVHTTTTLVATVGEGGRAFVADVTDSGHDAFRRVPTDTTITLYGVSGDDVLYAVGGPPATIVRITRVGSTYAASIIPLPADAPTDVRLFKVHDDGERIHIVGERGTYLVLNETPDGPTLTYNPVPGRPRLVTIHGPPGACVAVGGSASGYAVLLGENGARLLPPGQVAPLSGVFVARSTFATGFLGLLLERTGDTWREVPGLDPTFDGHAVFIDSDGVGWVAGGRLLDGTLRGGALWRIGPNAAEASTVSTLDVALADNGEPDMTEDDTTDAGPDVHTCDPQAPATALELGTRDFDGCFERYLDGAEATIINGPQGGSHVEVSLRFAGADPRIDLSLALIVDGTTVARFEADGFPTEVDVDDRDTRITTDLPVIFAGADASAWVGRTATLEATMVASGQSQSAIVPLTLVR